MGRWVDSRDLRVGDVVLLRAGETATVARLVTRADAVPVYNLEVAELHTFAVGDDQVLVHNRPGDGETAPAGDGGSKGGQAETGGGSQNADNTDAGKEPSPEAQGSEEQGTGYAIDPELQKEVEKLSLDPVKKSTVASARLGDLERHTGVSSDARSLDQNIDISRYQLPRSLREELTATLKAQYPELDAIPKQTFQALGHGEFTSLYLAWEKGGGEPLLARMKVDANRIMCAGPAGNCRSVLGYAVDLLGVKELYTRDNYGNVIKHIGGSGTYERIGKMTLEQWNAF